MSMEKKFNVGDRVRFTRDYDIECVCVDKGDCGTIEKIDDNGILITFDSPEYVRIFDTDYIESITPIDPKTAFLLELKGLLEKYNVCLIAHKTDMPISVYFEGEDEPCVTIGKEVNKGCGIVITADNIMDYEKE